MARFDYGQLWVSDLIRKVKRARLTDSSVVKIAESALSEYRKRTAWHKKREMFYKDKINMPINSKTGKPLKKSTIRAYERELNDGCKLHRGRKAEIAVFAALGFYGPPSKRVQKKHTADLKKLLKRGPETFFCLKNIAAAERKIQKTGAKVIRVDFNRQDDDEGHLDVRL